MADERFEGHRNRDCGEHRTTGARAWCFSCSEWCYPERPCAGCERPMLRAELVRFVAQRGAIDAVEYPALASLLAEAGGEGETATEIRA